MNYHFVPQFYLRNVADHEKMTSVYHIGSGKLIDGAPIKGQCYRVNSHSPATEARLCVIEGQQATLIRKILGGAYRGGLSKSYRQGVIEFVSLMLARNAYRQEAVKKNLNLLMTQNYQGNLFEELKKSFNEANFISETFSLYYETIGSISDMGIIFLENDTNEAFVSADNPVVIYNPLFQDVSYRSHRGIMSRGIVFYVPLSFKLALILFDKSIYDVKATDGGSKRISDAEEIESLNALSAVNASGCLYLKQGEEVAVKLLMDHVKVARSAHYLVYTESVLESNNLRRLSHMYEEFPDLNLRFSFLKAPKNIRDLRRNLSLGRDNPYLFDTNSIRQASEVRKFNEVRTVKIPL